MASLQRQATGTYHITISFGGRRYKRSLKTKDKRRAYAVKARVEETAYLIEKGRIDLPTSADVPAFLMSDGKTVDRPVVTETRLKDLFDGFFNAIPPGSLEPGTVKMMEIHRRHLERHFGARYSLRRLSFSDLQTYVSKRAKAKGTRGHNLNPATIKKELNTLRAVWKWSISFGSIPNQPFPNLGLRYPKAVELPNFQTFDEIASKSKYLDPSSSEAKELWATVFLNRDEIEELLDFVQQNARHEFVYPLFVFAAHTGARRSEMIRSQVDDFGPEFLTIRERKRKKGKSSTRQIPISSRLSRAIHDWFSSKPASPFAICHAFKSSCISQPGEGLTASQSNKHFQTTLKRSRFSNLRGWHVFRHSFCSNCAAQGVDQRIIDAWVGHTTDEMRRRYRHLFPNNQTVKLREVFG